MNKKALMQIRSGALVDVLDLKPDDFSIQDVAHSLSLLCRFNGHTSRFYSVAEHSIHVAELMLKAGYTPRLALMGLLHDAHEAFMGDMITPIKNLFPEFEKISDDIQEVIWDKCRCWPSGHDTATIKNYDTIAVLVEAKWLMGDPQWAKDRQKDFFEPISEYILPVSLDTQTEFLETFHHLMGRIGAKC